MSLTLELENRRAAQETVLAYAACLDGRDWKGFESLLEDEVAIDYGSIGSIVATLPARVWADRCRLLGAFDATHHKVSNLSVTLAGERATAVSYVDAAHFVTGPDGVLEGYLLGRYEHRLVRRSPGWRIEGCTLAVSGYPGGKARFQAAFALARSLHAPSPEETA